MTMNIFEAVHRRKVLLSSSVLFFPLTGAAQAFPIKPVKVIVPFSAGGGTDVIARVLCQEIARDLGQPFFVENKPGAGTVIGNDFVSKSPPDGYTLLLTTSAFSIVPSLAAKLPYISDSAFAPVGLLGRAPNVIVVNSNSRFKTLSDILIYAKTNPGKLSYGSAGVGTSVHLAAELLKNSAKIFMTHIPYRGASPMITDLLGTQVDIGFATMPSIASFVASGKLRAIAITSPVRAAAWPDVPAVAESGVKGYQADVWYGIFASSGTPPSVVTLLNTAIKRATQSEVFRKRVEAEGLITSVSTPQELGRLALADELRWKKIVKEQGITAE